MTQFQFVGNAATVRIITAKHVEASAYQMEKTAVAIMAAIVAAVVKVVGTILTTTNVGRSLVLLMARLVAQGRLVMTVAMELTVMVGINAEENVL